MTEREAVAGASDICGKDANDVLTVELKRRRAGSDAARHLDRYVEAPNCEVDSRDSGRVIGH
ncbi:endonuclease NucS domain-containing protein [Halococcus salsus]|uniref:endonuclease NucS domain-containing protein n=1 Tax=Halococcus salsus TaxID=2162894 RepID=UPI001F046617|nr:endonuclease NucS domain-containing protein [Halococcus salsus]